MEKEKSQKGEENNIHLGEGEKRKETDKKRKY